MTKRIATAKSIEHAANLNIINNGGTMKSKPNSDDSIFIKFCDEWIPFNVKELTSFLKKKKKLKG